MVALGLLLGAGMIPAGAASRYDGREVLGDGSELHIGCMWACACPILLRGPVQGGFRITETEPDPLYRNFLVTGVDWKVDETTWQPAMRFTGAGTYRVGGEVAVQHQLVLDLSIDGGTPLHLDSGLVPGGGEFPSFTIDIFRHGPTGPCYDTLVHVVARPAVTGVEDDARGLSLAIAPNPFTGRAALRFVMATSNRVDAGIYDLSGRMVRTLADDVALDAGPHELAWDGATDSGGRARPGLYFARVRAGGRESRAAIVLLR